MLLFALLPVCLAFIQAASIAQCPCNGTQQSQQIGICLGGITHQVIVTYCTATFCPPIPIADPCNPNSLGIDARTELISICPLPGTPLPTTDYDRLVGATVSAMSICHGNQLGTTFCFPNTDYHWIIRTPRCMFVDGNGCLRACPGSPCCGFLARYSSMPPGSCTTLLLGGCDTNGSPVICPGGGLTCHTINCPPPDHACW